MAALSSDDCRRLWACLDKGVPYVEGVADGRFFARIACAGDARRRLDAHAFAQRRSLVTVLGPILRDPAHVLRTDAASWIVREWGGIRSRGQGDRLPRLLAGLGSFTDEEIETFVATRDTVIASWSKLIAFARPERFAVFDSRVDAALRIAFDDVPTLAGARFFLPHNGQGSIISQARAELAKKPECGPELTYLDYSALLQKLVSFGCAGEVTHIEMIIWANAPSVAQQWLRANCR